MVHPELAVADRLDPPSVEAVRMALPSGKWPEVEGDLGATVAPARLEAGHRDPEQPDPLLQREHAPDKFDGGARQRGSAGRLSSAF